MQYKKYTMNINIQYKFLLKWQTRLCLLLLLLAGCSQKATILPEPVIPARVSFNSSSYTIAKDAAAPLIIQVKLARPIEKDGIISIQIVQEGTTAAATEYTIAPAFTSGLLSLELKKGQTAASFSVASAHNFTQNKTITFKITVATGGAVLGDDNLTTTLTLRGNDWLDPAFTTSVTNLAAFGNVKSGAFSASKSYNLTGVNLSGNVTVKASDNFQVSADNVNFSNSISLDVNNRQLPVYVRFAPASKKNQLVTGTITHSLQGLPDATVTVSGTETGNLPAETPLLNENFDYGNTTDFLTRLTTNWMAYSSAGAIPVYYVSQGLSFAGYANSGIGGAISIQNGDFSREDVAASFTPQTTGTLYSAVLVNIPVADASGDFFYAMRDAAGAFFNRLYARNDGAGNLNFGMTKTTPSQYATNMYKFNTTYLIVIKYDFATKISSLFVFDGNVPATEPTSSVMSSAATGTSPATLNDVAIRQSTNELSVLIDGIRVATTWKGVLGITN